ncbi:MAG TPA: hypothetical protein VK073_03035, partial [Pseudogracilibacillus sp.]|nr:hypothetical protein [Pseudogracilibacillus sp.]
MRITFKQIVILLGILLLLTACKPSDKYAGEWYAVSNEGKAKVDFSKGKVLTVEDENNHKETFDFNQHSSGFINNVKYYGLEMEDGSYYVVFENKKDEENAKLIKQTNHASD